MNDIGPVRNGRVAARDKSREATGRNSIPKGEDMAKDWKRKAERGAVLLFVQEDAVHVPLNALLVTRARLAGVFRKRVGLQKLVNFRR